MVLQFQIYFLIVYVFLTLSINLSKDVLALWASIMKYLYWPLVLAWYIFLAFYHSKRYSIWTSEKLEKDEENPRGWAAQIIYIMHKDIPAACCGWVHYGGSLGRKAC